VRTLESRYSGSATMDPVSSGLDPTTPLEAFNNATIATGGDSKLYNLNVFYDVSVACINEGPG
jgi:hypothetical protein